MGEPAAESASATMEALPEAVALVDEEDALMEAKIGALVNALSEHDEAASTEMASAETASAETASAETASVEAAVAPEPAPQAEVPPPVDAFIPPKPMEAQPRAPRVQKPEPFAEAAMTNGARTASNRSGSPSLLERMTGTGRARKAKETADDSTMPSAMTSTPPEDSMTASTAPAPSAEAVVAPALPQVAASDRLAPPRPDEDLLDIPAFLRRQAN